MPTNFPALLDTFTNPNGTTDNLNTGLVVHNVQHSNANDAILALEKVSVGLKHYNVMAYGAKGDVQAGTGGITNGAAIFVKASGPSFSAVDVGKVFAVIGAGVAGAPLVTTILSWQSTTQVTLAANASTTVVGAAHEWGTDNTAAVNTWLVDLQNDVGAFGFIPSGTFYMAGLNTVQRTRVRIMGAGMGATTLKLMPGSTQQVLNIGSSTVDCYIGHLTIDGNFANAPSGGSGIFINPPATRLTIEYVRITNCAGRGLAGSGTMTDSHLSHVYTDGNQGIAGIVVGDFVDIDHCTSIGNKATSAAIAVGANCKVSECRVVAAASLSGIGILVNGSDTSVASCDLNMTNAVAASAAIETQYNASRVRVTGNTIIGDMTNGAAGILIGAYASVGQICTAAGCVVDGNNLFNFGADGILLAAFGTGYSASAGGHTVTGNTLRNGGNGTLFATIGTLGIENDFPRTVISGNTIDTCDGQAIFNNAPNCVIAHNTINQACQAYVGGGIKSGGLHNVITENVIVNTGAPGFLSPAIMLYQSGGPSNTYYNTIANNDITDTRAGGARGTTYAIQMIQDGSTITDYCNIHDNAIQNMITAPLLLLGTHNNVFNNPGYNPIGVVALTHAATISLDPTLGDFFTLTTTFATGASTINAASVGPSSQPMRIKFTSDSTGGLVMTFGTNFRTTGTLTLTASKVNVVAFLSDGTSWIEQSRTAAIT